MIIYCIDTSALLEGWTEFPKENFGVWNEIHKLIEEKRLLSSYHVLNEIKRRDDKLTDWCKETDLFHDPTNETTDILKDILNEFPNFTPKKTQKVDWSDPWVLSMGIEKNCKMITQQHKRIKSEKICHIPDICEEHDIECLNFLDLIKSENWKFF